MLGIQNRMKIINKCNVDVVKYTPQLLSYLYTI